MGIGDYTSVMNTIVEKVCYNLRTWFDEEAVIRTSLSLFLDLSEPYYGCKLLLSLESIDFMLQNHTVFNFIHHLIHLLGRNFQISFIPFVITFANDLLYFINEAGIDG